MFLQKSTIRQSANWTFFCCESYGERKFILNLQIINFFDSIILYRNKTYINIKVQASLLIFSCKKIAGILNYIVEVYKCKHLYIYSGRVHISVPKQKQIEDNLKLMMIHVCFKYNSFLPWLLMKSNSKKRKESCCSQLDHLTGPVLMDKRRDAFLPEISPSGSPQLFIPMPAPSLLIPFTNTTTPKLSGLFKYTS